MNRRHEWVPGALALSATAMVALASLTPYVLPVPHENLTLIQNSQNTLFNGWLLAMAHFLRQRNKADDNAAPH